LSRPPNRKQPVEGGRSGLRTVSNDELNTILEEHRKWLHSGGGRQGKRADLGQTNLQGIDLQGADLRRALFQGSNLEGANLRAGKLQGAQLASANLASVDLSGAELSGADLSNTDLEDVKGLSANQLAGANLTNAKLPEAIRQFESLKTIAEASKLARPILLLILSAAVYTFLTLILTDDKALILNTDSQLIPQLKTPIPTAFFYRLAPFVILSLYAYFLLYLHWIWANVSTLPALFPDGTTLDKRIYPWLLNRLVAISSRGIDEHSLSHCSLSELVSIFLAWGVAPITLSILWFRYLVMHDWTWTLIHIVFFSAAVGIGKASHQRTVITLRGELLKAQALPPGGKSPAWRRAVRAIRSYSFLAWTAAAIILTLVISNRAINGSRPASGVAPGSPNLKSLINDLSYRVQSRFFANLSETDFTKENLENLKNLKDAKLNGADLTDAAFPPGLELGGINLREALLDRAGFNGIKITQDKLANGSLIGMYPEGLDFNGAKFFLANLTHASLTNSDLRGANLKSCHLENANLSGAFLQKAKLIDNHFQEANFGSAHLQGAELNGSDFRGAEFIEADLQGANLTSCALKRAQFDRAKLQGADLSNAYVEKAELFDTNFQEPNFSDAHLQGAELNGSDFRAAEFIAADLQCADLTSCALEGAEFIGAHLSHAYDNHFQEANFGNAHLQGAELNGSDFRGAEFIEADLQGANLTPCDLSEANLENAILENAELKGSNLSGANLKGAIMRGTHLQGADLTGCHLEWVNLSGANLEDVKGLTQAQLDKAFGDANTTLPPGLTITLYIEGMFPW